MQKLIKLFLLSSFIFFSFSLSAQFASTPTADEIADTTSKGLVRLYGSFDENSTALSNSMALQIQKRGYLSNDIIDKSAKNLWKQNYFGVDAGVGIMYMTKSKYYFGLGYFSHTDAAFSADAFNLVLKGNSMFAGEDANMKTTALNTFDYEKAEFGMRFLKGRAYGGLALLNGRNYQNLNFNDSKLFTQKDGQYIDATVHFNSIRNLKSGGFNPGLALHGGYRIMNNENMSLDISVKDLGFISWSGDQLQRSIETQKKFSGWVVPPMEKWTDTSYINESIDSVRQNFALKSDTVKGHTLILPFQVHIDMVYKLKKGNAYVLGGIGYTKSYSLPLVYIGYRKLFSKSQCIEAILAFGGYGKLNVNAAYSYAKKSFLLKAGIMGVEGLVIPSRFCGIGGFISISKRID